MKNDTFILKLFNVRKKLYAKMEEKVYPDREKRYQR